MPDNTFDDKSALVQGWGLLSQFLPFRYFPNFSALSKQTLAIEYQVYIWQVSPQLSCGDTCQIWMWFEKSNMYFCHIENFAYGEINERSFRNPHPRKRLGAIRQQAITWANVDPVLCHHIESLGHNELTHWGRVMNIYVSKLIVTGSDNGLSPGRLQAIILTNAGIFLIGTLITNFSEILSKFTEFHSRKCIWKCQGIGSHFVAGLNVLTN